MFWKKMKDPIIHVLKQNERNGILQSDHCIFYIQEGPSLLSGHVSNQQLPCFSLRRKKTALMFLEMYGYGIWAISSKILCRDCGFEKNGQWSLPLILKTPSGGFSLTSFSWTSGESARSSSVWMKNRRPFP